MMLLVVCCEYVGSGLCSCFGSVFVLLIVIV